jgi:uncharacterized protein (AIM24 family)
VVIGTGIQQSLGAGMFGGDGFVLRKPSGTGTAFVELGGESVVRDLAAGETMSVHPGHAGILEEGASFEITTIRGVRHVVFGGDGLFLARSTGPGRVWLQTLAVPKLAHALARYMPHDAT